ncbi:hypothetical protein ACTS94_13510 [Empedobacter falsenii]
MRNRKKLLNKSICLILENSNEEDDIKVYYGKVLKDKNESYYFTDNSSTIHLTLDEQDLDNAKVITQDKQKENEIFRNCDYSIWIIVNIIEIDEPTDDMKKTNMKWD